MLHHPRRISSSRTKSERMKRKVLCWQAELQNGTLDFAVITAAIPAMFPQRVDAKGVHLALPIFHIFLIAAVHVAATNGAVSFNAQNSVPAQGTAGGSTANV